MVSDRCPHSRQFEHGTPRCPAYQPVRFLPTDSLNQPLAEATTCRHLAVGTVDEQPGRFYPRCALGDRSRRLEWAERVGARRLQLLRELQREFDEFSLPYRRRLAAARAGEREAHLAGGRAEDLDVEIRAYLEAGERFLTERRDRLAEAGIALEPLLHLRGLLWGSSRGTPAARSAVQAIEDAAAHVFHPGVAVADGEHPAHADHSLAIRFEPERPGLALAGEVDAANVEALTAALERHLDGGADFHVDLSGIEFCDLAGVAAIVSAGRTLRPDQTLIVHGLPESLRRAMDLVGWTPEAIRPVVFAEDQA